MEMNSASLNCCASFCASAVQATNALTRSSASVCAGKQHRAAEQGSTLRAERERVGAAVGQAVCNGGARSHSEASRQARCRPLPS